MIISQAQTLALIAQYVPGSAEEEVFQKQMLDLVKLAPDFASRHRPEAHLTASAWVVNVARTACLLLHHQKLDRWLQPGGHIEPQDPSLAEAARREVSEETGLQALNLLFGGQIVDLDIHLIPASGKMAAHWHYDLRFAFEARNPQDLVQNQESKALGWFRAEEVFMLAPGEASMTRMVQKMLI
ncbi:MAG: NUDIX hydrolase [Microscillaceae bacterium]|nr:NUDIX hydrolase [Microscillaceae bacterium]